MGYSIEKVYKIYNDQLGTRLEIGPDLDGIGCFEMRNYNGKNELESYIFFECDAIPEIIHALQGLMGGK
jgi:hypothetical protein